MAKKNHSQAHQVSTRHVPKETQQERLKKARRDLWFAVAIVALIVLGFVLLYYLAVIKPSQMPGINVSNTPGGFTIVPTLTPTP
ncbi:MAG: hypothetical protein ACYC6L_18125 [Anaerolineae bacterium]